jgi:hypothetical protein
MNHYVLDFVKIIGTDDMAICCTIPLSLPFCPWNGLKINGVDDPRPQIEDAEIVQDLQWNHPRQRFRVYERHRDSLDGGELLSVAESFARSGWYVEMLGEWSELHRHRFTRVVQPLLTGSR